jgi:hypothetical protein
VVFDQLAHAAARRSRRTTVDFYQCVGAWLSYESRCDARIALVCEEELAGATVRRNKTDGCRGVCIEE